ncbi:thyroid adenoma-associated protein, partial [Phenoliferia sp. Uapishka_3]
MAVPPTITPPTPASTSLETIRDALVAEQRAKKKGLASSPAPLPLSSYSSTFTLALTTLSTPSTLTIHSVLALQVIELLLTLSIPSLATPELVSLYDEAFMTELGITMYVVFGKASNVMLLRCKGCLVSLIALENALDEQMGGQGEKAVLRVLKERLLVDPWLSKRSLFVFEVLLGELQLDAFEPFIGKGAQGSVEAGVLVKLVDVLVCSDELAPLAGKVALSWIDKILVIPGSTSSLFWISPIISGLIVSTQARTNISLYLLPLLFKARPETFLSLINSPSHNFLDPAAKIEVLESSLSILSAANTHGLIASDSSTTTPSLHALPLPIQLLSKTLTHLSPTLRISSFTLLFHCTSPSIPIPLPTFPLLQTFYLASLGEEDPAFSMGMRSATGRLLTRLKESSGKVSKDLSRPPSLKHPSPEGGEAYLLLVQSFLSTLTTHLLHSLNPAKPFRIKSNALKLLDQILSTGIDRSFSLAPGSIAGSPSTIPSPPWCSTVSLTILTPETTQTLLCLLQSTYTSLRVLAISVLERFPSPLPGYEGKEGVEKVERELLGPALKMVRSGREAAASAGAEVVALVGKTMGTEGWDLGRIGGWTTDSSAAAAGQESFLTSLMDLLDLQLAIYDTDLGRAASTTPIHGTILTLRHLFSTTLPSTLNASHRPLFLRALAIVERVWGITKVVLAANAPEGPMVDGVTDTEEARALEVEKGMEDEVGEGGNGEGEGTGGPMHKILLSATWRAMKEAGELVETLLRIPSEPSVDQLRVIWSLDDIKHIGDLYATWLALIRHRGAFMAIHPCYSRACSTLLKCGGWPEVQALPVAWLDTHLDHIVSTKTSITRRSAGIPYCILGILTAILPTNRKAFEPAFTRLFDIAESKTEDILDESRVHAMNTIQTAVLDGKVSMAVTPFVERGFLLAISMFWSRNWICRNAAMMLYAALVTRVFNARRTNLDRDHASLVQRVGIAEFFGKYPSLHEVLRSELEFSSREHLDDLPTANLHSSLFSVLMLLSLLQTPNRVDASAPSTADAFLPFVKACSKSRVWKIRDAAGDALTGLVSPSEVASVTIELLTGVQDCKENELHGRLVGALRLLEGSIAISSSALNTLIENLAPSILDRRHSYPVRSTFFNIARVNGQRSPQTFELAHAVLEESRSWDSNVSHLPGAETLVTAAFQFALTCDSDPKNLLAEGLETPFLSVQRAALAHISPVEGEEVSICAAKLSDSLRGSLIRLATSDQEASESRITALDLLVKANWKAEDEGVENVLVTLRKQHAETVIVPLREALLPLVARVADTIGLPEDITSVLSLVQSASGVDESVESREASVRALRELARPIPLSQSELFTRLVLRLLQDDDPTVRAFAEEIVEAKFSGGVPLADRPATEIVLAQVGPAPLSDYLDELGEPIKRTALD